jgi:hypothetical protein
MFLSVAKIKICSEIEPRIIRREELPEGYQPYWHATTALDKVKQQGLKSRKELGSNQMGLGDFGSSDNPFVSLTNDRNIANNISNLLRDVSSIAKSPSRKDAFKIAEELAYNLVKGTDVENKWQHIVYMARKSLVSFTFGGDANKEIVPGMTAIEAVLNGYLKGDSYSSKRLGIPSAGISVVYIKDLPEGSIPINEWLNANGESITSRYLYPYEAILEQDNTHATDPISYYQYLRAFIESAGGVMDPLLASARHKDFLDLDPEQIGVVETMTMADPADKTRALGEWRGYPQDTRVVLD